MDTVIGSFKSKVKKGLTCNGAPELTAVTSIECGQVNFACDVVDSPSPICVQNLAHFRNTKLSESLPNIDFYHSTISGKKLIRPSLIQLHQEQFNGFNNNSTIVTINEMSQTGKGTPAQQGVKFGWIIGVFVRCVLNILGPMLYLRLSWVAGQAGIGLATIIIGLSALVTTVTTLSMCAICTNGEIKGGGAYYMISRSLGPEFGGSMGLIFSLANSLAVGMHIAGFAETVCMLIEKFGSIIVDGGINDVRIVGVCTLVMCFCIVLIGVDFEVKAQLILLVILLVSIVNYVIGTFIPPPMWKQVKGVTGYSWSTFRENFFPDWRGESFFSVFAVFFPATTGIMAGANISGDLKEPGEAIPKGTLLAIGVTSFIYMTGAWMSASAAVRDASGNYDDLFNGTIYECSSNGTTVKCPYGIMNYYQTMQIQSGFGPLITAGIFAATLSSALACLVSGPKLLQAVGRDKLFPKLEWFSKEYGKQGEPRRAYFLGFFISLCIVCIGDLNIIAAYISNFYLATYALINYACFDNSIAQSPGWRPGFKYYSKWSALLGTALCVGCMFLMSWIASLLTCTFIIALYLYLRITKPDVNWGSSTQAHSYRVALKGVLKLLYTEEHVKNYRPQILALTANPQSRPALVDFVKCITSSTSLLIYGHIILHQPDCKYYQAVRKWSRDVYAWLRKRKAKGFYDPVAASSLKDGIRSLLQTSGIGKLKPNVVIMGFKNNWNNCTAEEIDDYFQMLHEAFECGVGVGVLRVIQGLDCSQELFDSATGDEQVILAQQPVQFIVNTDTIDETLNNINDDSDTSVSNGNRNLYNIDPLDGPSSASKISKFPSSDDSNWDQDQVLAELQIQDHSKLPPEVILRANQFLLKTKRPVIDIWWLCDDGGLTLLIPYLMKQRRSFLTGAKLRVFTAASNLLSVEQEQKNLNALLEKFRIKASNIKVINDLDVLPQASTVSEFELTIAPFKMTKHAERSGLKTLITKDEMNATKEWTQLHLRTHELLLEHSKKVSLIVITLPVPRKGEISSYLYLSWLDFLSKDLPPTLFVRGNQQSVLTFYS